MKYTSYTHTPENLFYYTKAKDKVRHTPAEDGCDSSSCSNRRFSRDLKVNLTWRTQSHLRLRLESLSQVHLQMDQVLFAPDRNQYCLTALRSGGLRKGNMTSIPEQEHSKSMNVCMNASRRGIHLNWTLCLAWGGDFSRAPPCGALSITWAQCAQVTGVTRVRLSPLRIILRCSCWWHWWMGPAVRASVPLQNAHGALHKPASMCNRPN